MDLRVEIVKDEVRGMRRLAVQLCLLVTLLVFALPARAQGYALIVIEHPFRAHQLAGIVVDPSGASVSGVVVEDCNPAFDHVLTSTTTDANGYFAFPQAKIGTTHYLHMQFNGFNPMRITVVLRRFAKPRLQIKLHIAT
jgi:hypothetical protein